MIVHYDYFYCRNETTMDCKKCHERLLDEDMLCFFRKGEKDVSLVIKPEMEQIVLANGNVVIEELPQELRESIKHTKQIACGKCYSHLGTPVPFGPGGSVLYAFGCREVILKGQSFDSKQSKWWKFVPIFESVDERTIENFFNTLNIKKLKVKKSNDSVQSEIVFPNMDNLKEFEWFTVSHDKTPRQYQIEAYVEVLQRNLVAVIKTGAGKTLIASMFLAKMCSLNPKKMGLFIVDRVPLAFQQAEALRKDTKLRVLSSSGVKTAYKLNQLNNNCFDILVITARAFYDLVAVKKHLDVNLFCAVVLDECHHVTKAHKYCDVLKMFTRTKQELQPRILGLTASPCNAKNVESAFIDLKKFFQSFPNDTKIFLPKLTESNHMVEEEKVETSKSQKDFVQKCVERFHEVEMKIKLATSIVDLKSLNVNLSNIVQVKGGLWGIEEEFCDNPIVRSHIKNTKILMDAMEMCNLMGVPSGVKILQQESAFDDICQVFGDNEEISLRLEKLKNTIQEMDENSKILVFVSQRTIARELAIKLCTLFPNKNVVKTVGSSGFDGMDQLTEQTVILENFQRGECKLLVCTSVLEEGIDVAQCDLVVYFTGVQNLIKYIQARGRARKQGSRFITYQEGIQNKTVDLKSEEENLQKALKLLNCQQHYEFNNPSKITQTIISSIENQLNDGDKLFFEQKNMLISKPGKSDFSFLVNVDQTPGVDNASIKQKSMESLEKAQELKFKRYWLHFCLYSCLGTENVELSKP